jgi:acyl-CoA thioesterase-2
MTARAPVTLLDQLDLEALGDTTFRSRTGGPGTGWYRYLYGGLVAAQSLRAAQLTVRPEHHVHSLHGYFLAAGKAGDAITLNVTTLRDGHAFSARHVIAEQGGEMIFGMSASFHREETGAQFQIQAAEVPEPDSGSAEWADRPHPDFPPASAFEFRDVRVPPLAEQGSRPAVTRWWARSVEQLPDDRDLHACVLTYLSDLNALTAIAAAIGVGWDEPRRTASLDHCVHFHRPIRMDDWVLVEMCPVSNGGNRGLVRNTMHSRSWVLGASVSQEGLLRIPGADGGA